MITTTSSTDFILPKCPQEICFNAEDFIKESFSVDQFLQDHRKKANLEIMRDDLGVYLKILRSAMIELINKDYTEFISLSTNLIDLDKKLDLIQTPIGDLSTCINQTHSKIENIVVEMNSYIRKKKQLKLQKQALVNIKHIESTMKILEKLHSCEDEQIIVERILSEITFIQFHINSCQDKQEFEKIKNNWESLKHKLLNKLKKLLLSAYNKKESDKVNVYITTLVNLTDIKYVEKIICEEIFEPLFNELINEESLQSDPRSLPGLFTRVLAQVDNLNIIFGGKNKNNSYNFLVNSIVPLILKRFTTNVRSIFAPGNAIIFHRRYKESFQFLNDLEEKINNIKDIKQIRSCEEYKTFVNTWNVTIYFQLQFQNISSILENSIINFAEAEINTLKNNDSKFKITKQTWNCIEICWSDDVFLPPIIRKLWKLTLQIVSRFCSFCDETLKENFWSNKNISINKIMFLVYLHEDIQWLQFKLSNNTIDLVLKKVILNENKKKCLEETLNESLQILINKLKIVEDKLINLVAKDSLSHIRLVNDIPRHFRRTNREMPTQISPYVSSLIASPLKFMNDFPNLKNWLIQIFSIITKEYFNSIREVITSVQRTEESLRRFKKIREKSSSSSGGENTKIGVGDEDKIKQQILLDVQHYHSVIKKTGLKESDIDNLTDLIQLVERSMSKDE